MNGFLCKIFRFVLNIFEKVVNAVASAVKTIGTAAVDVLSELAHSVGDAASGLFSRNGLLGILISGGILWMLLRSKDDDRGNSSVANDPTQKRAGSM